MIHLGFTGTRHGMTGEQMITVRQLIITLIDYEGCIITHHGACVGADAEFHRICMEIPDVRQIHQHVPRDPKLRANLTGGLFEEPLPYEQRNQAIVEASDYVIAAPLEEQPQIRGGTWQTIRMAQSRGNLWRIVFPSGIAVKG